MLIGTSLSSYGQDELRLIVFDGDTVAVLDKEEIKERLRYEATLIYAIDSLSIRNVNLEVAYEFVIRYSNANELTIHQLEEERDRWRDLFNLSDDEYDDLIKRCKKAKRASFIKGTLTGLVGGVILILILVNG